jgi:hypothetical protein
MIHFTLNKILFFISSTLEAVTIGLQNKHCQKITYRNLGKSLKCFCKQSLVFLFTLLLTFSVFCTYIVQNVYSV